MAASAIYCNQCGASNPMQAIACFACSSPLHLPAPSPAPVVPVQTASSNAISRANGGVGPLPPSSLLHSRYTIVCQVGTGGFGAVYLAKDTLFSHRSVAIKEMSQQGLSARELAEATAAFEREALLLADLAHPNLPRIHDHFSEHGRSYVVMDYIAGDTLEDYLGKVVRRLSVETTLEIALQLSMVLDYLHTRQPPLIFRDVKPANIMRTADNHVYLIDFGIARHFKPGKAKDTIPLGSRGYAAPEQYGKAQTTPQSDIYGLGATLHELLTGDDPSLSLFHFELVQLKDSPISTRLNDLLKRMVAMEMDKRPASMAVVKQELQQLLALQTAGHPSPMQKASQIRVGRRKFLLGFAGVVVTAAASSAITLYFMNHPNPFVWRSAPPLVANTPARIPAAPAPYAGKVKYINDPLFTCTVYDGPVSAVAWSPRGSLLASAGTLDNSVQFWDANTGNTMLVPAPVSNTPGARLRTAREVPLLFETGKLRVDALAWSPDGTRLAAALHNETVVIWNMTTGRELLLPFNQPGTGNALAWSPDGSLIAAVSGNISVQVRLATTGRLVLTHIGHTLPVLALAWSHRGTQLASGGADGRVQVWDAVAGDSIAVYSGYASEISAVAWSPDGSYIASGGSDGVVRVWMVTDNPVTLFTYRGHSGRINAVAWQKGLRPGQTGHIASAGDDGTIQVWSVARTPGATLLTLQGDIQLYRGHAGPVTSVAWAPDGRRIASSSEDGTVRVWQVM